MIRRRRGIALVNILMLAMVSTIFLMAATKFVADSMKESRTARNDAQLFDIGKSGITEAISWLRASPDRPVSSFDYVGDPAHTAPPDSLNEQIGLVKEWEIDTQRHLWARFEIGRDPEAPIRPGVAAKGAKDTTLYNPTTYPKFYSTYNDGTSSYPVLDWSARDISTQRGRSQAGAVWRLRCRAYTFHRGAGGTTSSPVFSLGDPNLRPIQSIEVEADVLLPDFKPKAACIYSFDGTTGAVVAHAANNCNATGGHIQIHGRTAPSDADVSPIDGMAYNIWTCRPSSDLVLNAEGGGTLAGPSLFGQTTATAPNYVSTTLNDQLQAIFGVPNMQTLRGIADFSYDKDNPPPNPLPQMGLIYIDPTDLGAVGNAGIVFDGAPYQLSGGGVLVVNGGVEVDGKTARQSWDGLIFASSYYHQFAGVRVRGSVASGARVIVHGDAPGVNGGPSSLNYSAGVLTAVQRQVVSYREQRSTLTLVPNSQISLY